MSNDKLAEQLCKLKEACAKWEKGKFCRPDALTEGAKLFPKKF